MAKGMLTLLLLLSVPAVAVGETWVLYESRTEFFTRGMGFRHGRYMPKGTYESKDACLDAGKLAIEKDRPGATVIEHEDVSNGWMGAAMSIQCWPVGISPNG